MGLDFALSSGEDESVQDLRFCFLVLTIDAARHRH